MPGCLDTSGTLNSVPRSELKTTSLLHQEKNDLGCSPSSLSPLQIKRRILAEDSSSVDERIHYTVEEEAEEEGENESRFLREDIGASRSSKRLELCSILNPNKAVMTLDASGKLLTVNDMATLLMGEDLLRDGTTIFDLLPYATDVATVEENLNKKNLRNSETTPDQLPHKDPNLEVAAEEDIIESEGMVVFSGNVVTVETEDMGEMPVSLWMKELPMEPREEPRWIAVIEPITTTVSKVIIDKTGLLVYRDSKFEVIFGSESTVDNDNLFNYISLNKIPDGTTEQEFVDLPCTAHISESETFPLSISFSLKKEGSSTSIPKKSSPNFPLYQAKIKLFSNISGLVVLDDKGIVRQYNHNFTRLLFGYGSQELEGEHISRILPDFQDISCVTKHQGTLLCTDTLREETSKRKVNEHSSDCLKDSSIPYIDDSLKENAVGESRSEDFVISNTLAKMKISESVTDKNSNCEGSCADSPNRAFMASDSQFTLSSNNMTSSRNNTQKSSLTNVTSNPSFNQTTTARGGTETPPTAESPVRNGSTTPTNIMRDITNCMNVFNLTEYPDQSRFPLNLSLVTSTPAATKPKEEAWKIQEGSYFSVAKHRNGSSISVLYQIRQLLLSGTNQYCVWITWEPTDSSMDASHTGNRSGDSSSTPVKSVCSEMMKEVSRKGSLSGGKEPSDLNGSSLNLKNESSNIFGNDLDEDSEDEEDEEGGGTSRSITRTDGSSANEYSLGPSLQTPLIAGNVSKFRSYSENDVLARVKASKDPNSGYEEPEWILTNGEYNDHYAIIKDIGKGAFGYVRMSYRKEDGFIVVTKFIKKSQVYKDSWTVNPETGKDVCLEVDLLMKLDHPNIVKALDFYENDKYFQLIMEKWGSGMDLFEFIDRNPVLDEPLTSYVFRQIVSALEYLHSLHIVHRDIKDENIIINQEFNVKLIDFGSATYMVKGKKFSQFAGTIEYCSPEVLKGHKYSGPELEVWSLGITLYTLIFGENPFNTVNQVIKESVTIPDSYSDDLFFLLCGMLKKDYKQRMKLQEVAAHNWTNQECDITAYSFEVVVPCSREELAPALYMSDYRLAEESFSTTSSSFVYESRQSHSATESSFLRSPKSADVLLDDSKDLEKGMGVVTAVSSRTSSSHSASSYKSSVTIDSSIFMSSSKNKNREDTCSSSVSELTETSTSVNTESQSQNTESRSSRRHQRTTDSLRSFQSLSSSLSDCSSRSSTFSDSSTPSIDSDDSNSSTDDENDDSKGTLPNSVSSSASDSSISSSSSSSYISQNTVSVDSGSEDDNTLANTYTNILALADNEDKNN